MQSFTNYISESVAINDMPKTVLVGSRGQAQQYGHFRDAIATIGQKLTNKDQSIFLADSFDHKEFGKLLKNGDTLCRISTPLSSDSHENNRTVCIINIKKANIRFVDNEKYEQGIMALERANKFRFLNINEDSLKDFGITGDPTEDSRDPFRPFTR
jgi:hypothetical protein|tara:strand:+ start:203 stop:670 length:468 start_codon:yes stop_codon:yes gene_type:complete